MKILHLNYTDTGGGAAIAALNLVEEQNKNDIDAKLGVIEKQTASQFVISVAKKRNVLIKIIDTINFIFDYMRKCINPSPFLFFKTTNGILHSKNNKTLADIKWINNSDFDVVHLHWINSNMLTVKDIAKIKKPIVWTMHDSWPFCGAEHHPNVLENDNRYQSGYYRNNKPKSTHGIDLCRKVWNKKKKYLQNKEIVFISPSTWERDCLKQSKLFSNKQCFVIPNIIQKDIFRPLDKIAVRNFLQIPNDKKIIGFGAAYDVDNPRGIKGSYYLLQLLNKLPVSDDYFLVIFGSVSADFTSKINVPFFASGFVHNPLILAQLYNACDCFILPSLIESFGLTTCESICCGIPVVAFDVGGTNDIIKHKTNGYLARPYDVDDLLAGVEYCIENYGTLSINCLEKAKKDFDNDIIIKQHLEVYETIINNK
ncbi:MAG: glycosyltransferase [Spirochaetales bacterium]|nr:glycosyltransferase [Spirochaetales bacterium]